MIQWLNSNCFDTGWETLLFGGYKFHLAKLNRDINHGQDNKIGLLASDSVRIAFFQQKTGAKTSKCTTLLPKSQFWQNWNAHCLSNLLLQDVPQQNQNNKCRVYILSKSGYSCKPLFAVLRKVIIEAIYNRVRRFGLFWFVHAWKMDHYLIADFFVSSRRPIFFSILA